MGTGANGEECPCSWGDKAKAIALVIAAIGGGILTPIITAITLKKTDTVESVQVEHVKKTEDAATEASATKEIVAKRTDRIENIEKTVNKTDEVVKKTDEMVRGGMASNLEASWRYLQKIADDTELPDDIAAAKASKRAYDDFVAKYGKNK